MTTIIKNPVHFFLALSKRATNNDILDGYTRQYFESLSHKDQLYLIRFILESTGNNPKQFDGPNILSPEMKRAANRNIKAKKKLNKANKDFLTISLSDVENRIPSTIEE